MGKDVEIYSRFLGEVMEAPDYLEKIKKTINIILMEGGELAVINFVLFTLFTADRLTHAKAKEIFSATEERYFEKLLLIESSMEHCFEEIQKSDIYKKAIDTYATYLNHA